METYDLIIIGAGPAGLSCAIEAQKNNLSYLMIEKGNVVESIMNFPVSMIFFSTADQLELGNIPFNSQNFRPTRIETVRYYQSLVSYYKLKISTNSLVDKVEKNNDIFNVRFERNGEKHNAECRNLVIATGFYDNPNNINVSGEELPHVSHYFTEALRLYNQDVVIVGGKNSAVEAALEAYRSGARVTIVHRKNKIKESVKYWVLPDIENRIKEGSIKTFLDANLTAITEKSVHIDQNGKEIVVPADAVFLLTGYHPDVKFLDDLNVIYDHANLESRVDEATLQTNVEGLYLAGSLIAGRNANRIFIENSREHGQMIVGDILKRNGV
jgi:putative YpdA family bacillithiol system oxidoreductase